jgi:S-adenosylmethionine uptake transporter
MSPDGARNDMTGGAWLIADMSLNIWALSIVKWLGADYPASQIVFIRAVVGLLVISPLIWRGRERFHNLEDLKLHLVRVILSVITLSASFFAIPRVPLAVFTAAGFTRPLITMMMAAVLLHEVIGVRRWVAAAVALVGIVIAINPGAVTWDLGLAALGLVIISGSGAIIAMRRLRAAPPLVMMTFYTVGLAVFSAPMALMTWQPVQPDHVVALVLMGCFAQSAQLCFLRAHYHGGAGFLSVLGYLSLILSVGVGYFVFDEVPGPSFAIGAALVVGAALWVTVDPRILRVRS